MKSILKLFEIIETEKKAILEAERYIWRNPEAGYKEWKTHAYLKEKFENLGYDLVEAGDIPGFYTDLDTGIPGPKVAIFGELDSLVVPTHPQCDPATGAVHACGHNCQCAALLGVAIALKAPGALDGLCGSIRLVAVPAEEGIEMEYRRGLKKEGVIRYPSGKTEFLSRGYLDGVDLSMMLHAGNRKDTCVWCPAGSNGNVVKKATFRGKSAHAGGSPHKGINALYAATTAITAANAIRETFQEKDTVRFHPIITKGGTVVNAIPDEVITEAYIRGASYEAIALAGEKINRAFAGAAAAMGCTIEFEDEFKSAPRINDANFRRVFGEVASMIFPKETVNMETPWVAGCSDMGDISCVMPTIHPYICGVEGIEHGDNFIVSDPEKACVAGAKILAGVVYKLLCEEGKTAKKILAEAKVPFATKEEFLARQERMRRSGDRIEYLADGGIRVIP